MDESDQLPVSGKLFCQLVAPGESSAYVGINQGALHWKVMADGFLEVAERACSPFHSPDAEIYAVLTCLRHGIELFVKYMVVHVSHLPSTGTKKKFKQGHNILDNWTLISEEFAYLSREIEGHDFGKKIQELSQYIEEIDLWDVSGQAFRYPQDKKGNRNLAGVQDLNAQHLQRGINRLRTLLSELEEALGDYYPS